MNFEDTIFFKKNKMEKIHIEELDINVPSASFIGLCASNFGEISFDLIPMPRGLKPHVNRCTVRFQVNEVNDELPRGTWTIEARPRDLLLFFKDICGFIVKIDEENKIIETFSENDSLNKSIITLFDFVRLGYC